MKVTKERINVLFCVSSQRDDIRTERRKEGKLKVSGKTFSRLSLDRRQFTRLCLIDVLTFKVLENESRKPKQADVIWRELTVLFCNQSGVPVEYRTREAPILFGMVEVGRIHTRSSTQGSWLALEIQNTSTTTVFFHTISISTAPKIYR